MSLDNGINHSKFLQCRVKKHQCLQFVYNVWFLKKLFTVICKNNGCMGGLSWVQGVWCSCGGDLHPCTHPLDTHVPDTPPQTHTLDKLSLYTHPTLHTHTPHPGHTLPSDTPLDISLPWLTSGRYAS